MISHNKASLNLRFFFGKALGFFFGKALGFFFGKALGFFDLTTNNKHQAAMQALWIGCKGLYLNRILGIPFLPSSATVKVKGLHSSRFDITSGVPDGKVLLLANRFFCEIRDFT